MFGDTPIVNQLTPFESVLSILTLVTASVPVFKILTLQSTSLRSFKYSEYLKDLRLVDYKVRILNTGTEAVTRVSIESTDSKGVNWFTIGVSPNIIDASFKALVDSLDYKLFKDKAPGSS